VIRRKMLLPRRKRRSNTTRTTMVDRQLISVIFRRRGDLTINWYIGTIYSYRG
jgi:hypothetical protein